MKHSHKICALFFGIFLAVIASALAEDVTKTAATFEEMPELMHGEEAYKAGDLPTALQFYKHAYKKNPLPEIKAYIEDISAKLLAAGIMPEQPAYIAPKTSSISLNAFGLFFSEISVRYQRAIDYGFAPAVDLRFGWNGFNSNVRSVRGNYIYLGADLDWFPADRAVEGLFFGPGLGAAYGRFAVTEFGQWGTSEGIPAESVFLFLLDVHVGYRVILDNGLCLEVLLGSIYPLQQFPLTRFNAGVGYAF